MRLLYSYRFRCRFGTVCMGALLAGCASTSTGRHDIAKAQPLQRMSVPQTVADKDPLALELAGEFALNHGDLDTAANRFVQAAQVSDDPDIAAQATRVAIAAKQWKQAHAALERWQV